MHFSNTLALAALAGNSLAATIGKRANLRRDEACTETEVVTITTTVTAYGSPTGALKPPVVNAAAAAATAVSRSEDTIYSENRARDNNHASIDDFLPGPGSELTSSGNSPSAPLSTKRGFAYNDADLVNSLIKGGAEGSWAYNWDSHDNGLDSSVEFVPMLWSNGEEHVSRWDDNVQEMLGKGAKCLLSFNEPDHQEQAKMDPETAAAAHAKYLNPYGDKARIGAPAITNSNLPGEGTEWLEKFIPACEREGCQIDFCVAHWYAPADDDAALRSHLEKVHELCGGDKPVWLTEFAPQGDEAASVKFIHRALHLMDEELEWVERYSYFMVGGPDGGLTNADGGLSAKGQAYFEGN
ncbi:hypothetical protein VUR80DRAFT_1867 [Thermomyces stellatus]